MNESKYMLAKTNLNVASKDLKDDFEALINQTESKQKML